MAPKIPSEKELAAELAKTVREIYASGEHEGLTVNFVRSRAEEKLGLTAGFFKSEEWKTKSKELIKDTVVSDTSHPN